MKVSRSLFMIGVILSGFHDPVDKGDRCRIFRKSLWNVGASTGYHVSLPYSSVSGADWGIMLMASGNTKAYMYISGIVMLCSLPISYIVQAPPMSSCVHGLGLGAIGMAIKMVSINIISVNVLAWVVARKNGWKFDWFCQIIGMSLMIGSGYLVKYVAELCWDLSLLNFKLLLPVAVSGILYLVSAAIIIWRMPWLIGMTGTSSQT